MKVTAILFKVVCTSISPHTHGDRLETSCPTRALRALQDNVGGCASFVHSRVGPSSQALGRWAFDAHLLATPALTMKLLTASRVAMSEAG
jgi:hypothetical protein